MIPVPRIPQVEPNQRLDFGLVNHIIKRTEYAAELLRQYKCVAGDDMFVEPHPDGTRISYLQAVGGGIKPMPLEEQPTVNSIGWMVSKLLVSGNPNLPYIFTVLPGRAPIGEFIAYRVDERNTQPYGITWNLRDSQTADTSTRYGAGVFDPPLYPFLYPGIGGLLAGISIDKGFNIKVGNILSANGPKIINLGWYKTFMSTYLPGYYPGRVPPNSFSGSGYKAYWSAGNGAFDFFGQYIITEGDGDEFGIGELMV